MLLRLKLTVMLVGVGLLSQSQQVQAQVAKLYPVDEASRDPSFFVFRCRLLQALEQRDVAFLLTVVSPGIRNSFGDNGGVAEFQKHWRPERPDSQLWKTLTEVLSLGGAFEDGNTFAAPYTYSKFPDQFDAFDYGVIVGENVRVRQKGAADSPVIATLSFDIVSVLDWASKQATGSSRAWIPIKLAGGSQGYVAAEFLRSPMDYRALFEKKGGKWMMMALVSGD
jgi:hypothetical protein